MKSIGREIAGDRNINMQLNSSCIYKTPGATFNQYNLPEFVLQQCSISTQNSKQILTAYWH